METTQLYIELIIIGLEGVIWMCAFLADILGNKITSVLANILDNFSSSLLLIGILYVVGVLVDRLADIIFQKKEDDIRIRSGLHAKSSIIVWKKYNAEKYAEYSRTRVRILRASILNLPMISISFILYVIKYLDKSYMLVIYIIILGVLFTYISWKSYNLSLIRYYDKACALESSGEMKQ